jgi:hypothetical protein
VALINTRSKAPEVKTATQAPAAQPPKLGQAKQQNTTSVPSVVAHKAPVSKLKVTRRETRINSPNIQTCPNGNCIGGDDYGNAIVNNYGPPERKLTADQRAKLIDALKPVCPFDVAVRGFPGSVDAMKYADQIRDAIHAAGCNPMRPKFLIDQSMQYGMFVAIHDDQNVPKGFNALLSVLQAVGIKAQPTLLSVIEPTAVYVLVEPPEPSGDKPAGAAR